MKYCYFDGLSISRITLGTVQLSIEYGISNKTKPTFQTTHEVLEAAQELGITSFDTSPQYGDIERILGNFFRDQSITDPILISKIPLIQFTQKPNFDEVYQKVKKYVEKSMSDLNLKKIPICLIHNPQDMDSYEGMVVKSLEILKQNGRIGQIGCSVYTIDEVRKFLTIGKFQVIEIPVNLFNTKIITERILSQLGQKNIIVLARSIFLQGLFFLDPDNLPPKVKNAKRYLIELNKISKDYSISIPQLALSFVNNQKHISSIVIGVENRQQLYENMKWLNSELPEKLESLILEKFSNVPESINNPLNWI
ncbi:MAG: aldo/keto reductase [Nitrosopumilaceae archaeon]